MSRGRGEKAGRFEVGREVQSLGVPGARRHADGEGTVGCKFRAGYCQEWWDRVEVLQVACHGEAWSADKVGVGSRLHAIHGKVVSFWDCDDDAGRFDSICLMFRKNNSFWKIFFRGKSPFLRKRSFHEKMSRPCCFG